MKKKQTKKRLGRPAKKNYAKPLNSLQKARATQKALKAKLVTLKAEFKTKLKSAVEDAYAKAYTAAIKAHEKKLKDKQKILTAAETKFEKKYAKKLAKTTKTKPHKKHPSVMSAHQTTTKKNKRVGRPRMTRSSRRAHTM